VEGQRRSGSVALGVTSVVVGDPQVRDGDIVAGVHVVLLVEEEADTVSLGDQVHGASGVVRA
jgi:hypothetical protein